MNESAQLTGQTRSSFCRDHAVIAPESQVPLTVPGFTNAKAVYLLAPQMGAKISQYLGLFEGGGSFAKNTGEREIFFYVLEGGADLSGSLNGRLAAGAFAYLAPATTLELRASGPSRVLFFEKTYEAMGAERPHSFLSHENQVPAESFLGDEGARLQTLLPKDMVFDMAVNIFEFAPGGTLPQVEMHYMEHGLYFLQGEGVYRLSDRWYIVRQDDTLWMGPHCLQWFAATGKRNTKYIYYKEANRDPHSAPR